MNRIVIHKILESGILLQENLLVQSDNRAFRTVAIGLILAGDDSYQKMIILNENNFRMVHRQVHIVKTRLHHPIQLHGFLRGFKISQQNRVTDQPFLSEVKEAAKEGVRRREGGNIYIRTSGLLQDPTEQTECMEPLAEIALCGTPGKRS